MTIRSVAFVPSAPLLVSEVAGGSAGLDDALRAACRDAVERATASPVDEVRVVAGVEAAGPWSSDATWDFGGFGVEQLAVGDRPRLPWPLGIGGWLLDACGWSGPRRYVGVDGTSAQQLTARDGQGATALLVVGDGTSCRTERAPGHFDERAEAFDRAVAELLAHGDAAGLGRLDQGLAEELVCGAVPTWKAVAAALEGSTVDAAELLADVAPYGVGYFVALWSLT
jgi:hypothetical protein